MRKKQQMIMLEESIYLEARRQGIIQRRELSKMINDFLKTYFSNDETLDNELIKKKKKTEEELKKTKQKEKKLLEELSIIKIKINSKEEKNKQTKKELNKEIKMKADAFKSSNILNEVLDL